APGERVTVEAMRGDRTPHNLTMTGTLGELMGMWIHMPASAAERLFGQAAQATDAMLMVERGKEDAVQARLNDMPIVNAVTSKQVAITEFRKQTGESQS